MSEILFLVGVAVVLVGGLVYAIAYGKTGGSSGVSTTVFMGATHEMLNEDQRKAAEVIVEEQTGNKTVEQDSGEDAPESPEKDGLNKDIL